MESRKSRLKWPEYKAEQTPYSWLLYPSHPEHGNRLYRLRRPTAGENWLDKTPAERHVAMTWMQRLKRVFNIDIETCERCVGQVKIIACI